ncbi:MAG: GSCFA domain-containing protein [Bacteroidaceae bacterium]|nr:GSCFA domain-containing protein [Bacteroidaceae bacterium]
MELMTRIDIPASEWKMETGAKVLLVGSCFADEVGQRFVRGGFEAMVNPFGTLYNPASIAVNLLRALSEKEVELPRSSIIPSVGASISTWGTPVDRCGARRLTGVGHTVFEDAEGRWHSWLHHSSFSSTDVATVVERINSTTHRVADFLRGADVLIVTLGTAIIYRLKETGMLVANCHKQPDNLFVRERLNAYDIVDQWQMLLQLLESVNPNLKVIFTVSPIRHKRDGYHVNQISKGILLQAVDEIVNGQLPNSKCGYFPSYEIMMDELRDYRFYADDMIHPSEKAVEYIWQRFQDTYFDNKTKDVVAKATKEWRKGQHRTIIDN